MPAASGQQSLPMPAQRPPPSSQTLQGMMQTPWPAGPVLPARKAGAPAQHPPFGGLHGGPRLPEPKQQTPLSLLKASPSSGAPRPAHVVVVGEKHWAAPNQVSADKSRVTSGQHSLINVDARSAPKGPGPQGVPTLHPRAAPWASGQPIPGRERPAVSAPSPALLPIATLGRPQVLPQSMPLKAPQAVRPNVTPTRYAPQMNCVSSGGQAFRMPTLSSKFLDASRCIWLLCVAPWLIARDRPFHSLLVSASLLGNKSHCACLSTSETTHRCCREERTPAPFFPGKGAWHNMKIPIVCNGNRGYYLVHSSTCICCCVACNERAKRADLPCIQISPTEFERHSGRAASPSLMALRSLYHGLGQTGYVL